MGSAEQLYPGAPRSACGDPPAPESGTWVDTVTLWSAVQRTGEELQRRKLAAGQPSAGGGGASCVGIDWASAPRRAAQRLRTSLVVMARVVVKDPTTAVVPAAVLVCLLAFGLWGVFSVAVATREGRQQTALNAAVDFSQALKSHVLATVTPATTVATLIQLSPGWPAINETFFQVAPSLGAGPEETFGANGSAFNCSPCFEPATSSTPSSRFWGFAQLNVRRVAISWGVFRSGGGYGSASVNCSQCLLCVLRFPPYAHTSIQARPFPAEQVDWEVLVRNVTRLYDLCERVGLAFNMTYVDPVTHVNRSIAACGHLDAHPVSVDVDVMQNHWVIAALRRGEDYAEAFENVTILFSDIVSYTSLASTIEPIMVVRLLNTMYSAFDALVDRYDCYK
ncbi:Atrial natriuretic peptide receptor 2, partial [Tetrabaena socialis]